MSASLSARLALIAILVFCQAAYAEHLAQHGAGSQPECQTCLQTYSGSAALPCSHAEPGVPACSPVHSDNYVSPTTSPYFNLSCPSRAPPLY